MDVYEEIFGEQLYSVEHSGVAHDENPPGRGSGRYAFGSGARPNQHNWDILSRIEKYQAANPGLTDAQVAAHFGWYKTDFRGNLVLDKNGNPQGSSSKLRAKKTIAISKQRMALVDQARNLLENGDPITGKPFNSKREIAERMGLPNESSVRSLLDESKGFKGKNLIEARDKLKDYVEKYNYISLGPGTANELGLTTSAFNVVKEMLREEGYITDLVSVRQNMDTGYNTSYLVLCPPGSQYGDAGRNMAKIREISMLDFNPGTNLLARTGNQKYESVDLSRINIKYKEQEGDLMDGVIELRGVRNPDGTVSAACPDLDLGNAKYGQVRIAVKDENGEDKYYLKGMAIYNPDLPPGTDIQVNSKKSIEGGVEEALKELKRYEKGPHAGEFKDLPFGSAVWQTRYIDPETGEDKPSLINFVGSGPDDAHKEGHWGNWSKNLPAQFLSKQSLELAQQQLGLSVKQKNAEFDEIMSLTNPVVKGKLLEEFSDNCDSAAVDLKAHRLPGQGTHVILPVNSLSDNEIYAPRYPNGTKVCLIRYPHTGAFEIPYLTVNNDAKGADFMKGAVDAVGFNHNVAQILSGADFDGDTVTVIPVSDKFGRETVRIKSLGPNADPTTIEVAKGLSGFDTDTYATDGKKKTMTASQKGKEMGIVSNLITDMSLLGVQNPDHLIRAVKYSMVVIDAEKHKLDWKQAAKDFGIDELKRTYQVRSIDPETGEIKYGGAATLISKSKSEERVPVRSLRKDSKTINPETGEREWLTPKRTEREEQRVVYAPAPEGYKWKDKDGNEHRSKTLRDENGKQIPLRDERGRVVYETVYNEDGTPKMKPILQKSTKMYEHKDARELLSNSGNPVEMAYADYANEMKALGNKARKALVEIPTQKMDPAAKKEYAAEVKSLNEKLKRAESNSARQRQAKILANQIYRAQVEMDPDLTKEEKKKIRNQAEVTARERTGAHKDRVTFTDREWEAVQHNAISDSTLRKLLNNSDSEHYKQLAMPRTSSVAPSTAAYIEMYKAANPTLGAAAIAEQLGYSPETVQKVLLGQFTS